MLVLWCGLQGVRHHRNGIRHPALPHEQVHVAEHHFRIGGTNLDRKLEALLKASRIKKPSQIYQIVSKAAGDEAVFLLYHSQNRVVQERIRNYIQKYIPRHRIVYRFFDVYDLEEQRL